MPARTQSLFETERPYPEHAISMLRRRSPSFERSHIRHRTSQPHYKNTSLSRRRARQRAAKAKIAAQQSSNIRPPQLPRFDFEIYNAPDYLPAWCPPMPSFRRNGQRPLFFDLSGLPEPASSPHAAQPQSKKVSRYFPPRAISSETVVAQPVSAGNYQNGTPSAANLWNILSTAARDKFDLPANRESTDLYDSKDAGGVLITTQPLELREDDQSCDTFKIAYVHPNSLAGYANDAGRARSEDNALWRKLHESAFYMAELTSPVDVNLPHFELPWSLTSHSSTPPAATASASTQSELPTNDREENRAVLEKNGLVGSLEHYDREQQLFADIISLPESTSASGCGVAIHRSLIHVEDCCRCNCGEAPVLVEDETESSLTEQDGWMVWEAAKEGVPAGEYVTAEQDNVADCPSPGTLAWYDEYDWSV